MARWKEFLKKIGRFQGGLLLYLTYFLLWVPVGFLCLFFTDWLGRRPPRGSTGWWPRPQRLNDPSHTREPF